MVRSHDHYANDTTSFFPFLSSHSEDLSLFFNLSNLFQSLPGWRYIIWWISVFDKKAFYTNTGYLFQSLHLPNHTFLLSMPPEMSSFHAHTPWYHSGPKTQEGRTIYHIEHQVHWTCETTTAVLPGSAISARCLTGAQGLGVAIWYSSMSPWWSSARWLGGVYWALQVYFSSTGLSQTTAGSASAHPASPGGVWRSQGDHLAVGRLYPWGTSLKISVLEPEWG